MSADFADKSVLVVDNSPVIARLVKNYLINLGFVPDNVWIANDGNQASMMIGLKEFNLVTSSLHLNFMSGVQLLKEIRGNADGKIRSLPFVVISAERKEYYAKDLEEAGCDGYLQKPFKIEQLKKTVHDVFYPKTETPPARAEAEKSPEYQPKSKTELKLNQKIVHAFVESTVEALGQYMAEAVPGEPAETGDLSGDFSSMIDLTDSPNAVKSLILLYFPKKVACKIYEGIFGEVDTEQVCGVVQELGNIIGGIVKPKISDLSLDIFSLIHPGREIKAENGNQLNFQLGLPSARMEERHTVLLEDATAPKFIVPFDIQQEKIFLLVQFQKYNP